MNHTLTQHQLLCILDALQESMHKLPEDSIQWAMCFDSANEVRQILGQPALSQ